jgi:hypothetical protein
MDDRSARRVVFRGRIALAAILWTVLATSVVAAGDDGAAAVEAVIPPGEEQVVAAMLGRGTGLQYCTLVSGGIADNIISGVYNCLGNEVRVELGNPSNAAATSIRTGQFAVTVQGSPTAGFQDDLISRVRSAEGNFQWTWPQRDAAPPEGHDSDDAAE